MAYVRTVKTASGATAVQIVYSKRRGARRMEYVGSAHDEQELEALKAAAAQLLAGGQQELEQAREHQPTPAVPAKVIGGPARFARDPGEFQAGPR